MKRINWNRRKYTEEEFIEAWKSSKSIAEVIRKLGLNRYGSTYNTMRDTASALGLNRDHMTGKGWNVGDKFGLAKRNLIPMDEILVENSTYITTSRLKVRLIADGYLENKCSAPFCPVPNPSVHPFTGEVVPLKLALDHINGINNDNRLENLRLLCYHCHGLTETFCRGPKPV